MSPAVRLLVATDDPAEAGRVTTALGEEITVVAADTPWEARRLARGGGLDVLVLDGDLEPMGGFALLYELRADAELEGADSPPAVVLINRPQDRWLAAWAGADRTLLKPVDPFRLAREVGELAGRAAARRDRVEEAGEELEADQPA